MTSFYRQLNKKAVLRPDIEWDENDSIETVDIPRVSPVRGQLEDPIRDYDGDQLEYQAPISAHMSQGLSLSMKEESNYKNTSKQSQMEDSNVFFEEEEDSARPRSKQASARPPNLEDDNDQEVMHIGSK